MSTQEKENTRLIDLTVFDLKNIVSECISIEIERSVQKGKETEILTRKDVCKLLQISDATLYVLMQKGTLKYISMPGAKQKRFKRTDVLSFIENNPKYKRK